MYPFRLYFCLFYIYVTILSPKSLLSFVFSSYSFSFSSCFSSPFAYFSPDHPYNHRISNFFLHIFSISIYFFFCFLLLFVFSLCNIFCPSWLPYWNNKFLCLYVVKCTLKTEIYTLFVYIVCRHGITLSKLVEWTLISAPYPITGQRKV
jgi:hypothetical protein